MSHIEISPLGNFLMYKTGYTAEFIKQTIDKNKLNGLRIFDDAFPEQERLTSFDFLAEYDFLEGLEIATIFDNDYSFLKSLPKLKHLSLQNESQAIVDLSCQSNLETLYMEWRKGLKGLEKCVKLKNLGIHGIKSEDLELLAPLHELRWLKLLTSKIRTLNGISNCGKLATIIIGYCRSLTSIKDINGLPELNSLEVDSCSRVQDFNLLTDLPNLETLEITNCGKIPSIKFLKNFPKLTHYYMFGNTDVIDSDLKPAKNIKDVIYIRRRHYNIRIENKAAEERYKRNLEILRTGNTQKMIRRISSTLSRVYYKLKGSNSGS
jgi:hypothetical protein